MIVGTHTAVTGQEKIHLVLRAAQDLATSLEIKTQRQREGAGRGWMPLGPIEQIIFEVDRGASLDDLRSMGAQKTGRRLYWPDPHTAPMLARTMPEEDLIFTRPWPVLGGGRLKLPDIPDPTYIVKNPYKVDRRGTSHLKNIEDLERPRMIAQAVEKIASGKSGRFLVCHPIAQIILFSKGRGGLQYSAFGSPRMPISSLSGFDDRKMALLVDPYNGEAFFSGGRYQLHAPDVTEPTESAAPVGFARATA